MSDEVIVVGAGPNGLSAAVALAQHGFRVTVHEASARIGGGTRSDALTLPGFIHDVCSAVHPLGIGSPFFRTLPLDRHGLEWIHPPIPMAHPFEDGTAAVLERSIEATGDSLGRGDARMYRKLIEPFVRKWEPLFSEVLAPPIRIPRHPFLMARMGRFGMRSAMGLAASLFESPRARAYFVGIAAHTLMPMEMLPSAAFSIVLAVAGHAVGWPIPRGGSQRIADALAALLHDHQGRIETSSRIDSIGRFDDAAAVLLDVTPRQLLTIAGERFPPRFQRQLRRWRYAPGVFKIDWALSAPIPWTAAECRRAGTIHVGGTAEEIAKSASDAWNGRDDERPYVLLAQPSLFDDTRAPAGRHTAWAYCHVPNGSTRDMTAAIERQVERFAPGFRDIILARHTFNTRQIEDHNANLVGGDINGGVQDVRQFIFRPSTRLNPYSTPDPRVFLCSASTPPGGAVHGMCGYHAAMTVIRRLKRS